MLRNLPRDLLFVSVTDHSPSLGSISPSWVTKCLSGPWEAVSSIYSKIIIMAIENIVQRVRENKVLYVSSTVPETESL